MKAVIYARCSTSQHDQNPEVQTEELRRYCRARGWEIVEEVVDHGFSGATDKRPGLKRLNELVKSRRVDVVIVVKLDRLFRSIKHLITTLQDYSDIGVEFVSIKDQVDLTTASGRLMLHIIGAFAEFERALIRERTVMGLDYARSKGKKLGRPRAHDFDEIRKMHQLGKSLRQIQRELGCSLGTVYRATEAAPKTPQNAAQPEAVKTRGYSG